jgi:hypothetical protein
MARKKADAQPGSAYIIKKQEEAEGRHTFAVIVSNEPGVLARVIGLFSGRGYNIESLTVAPVNEDETMSRITIVEGISTASCSRRPRMSSCSSRAARSVSPIPVVIVSLHTRTVGPRREGASTSVGTPPPDRTIAALTGPRRWRCP